MSAAGRLTALRRIGLVSLLASCPAGCQAPQKRLASADPLERARGIVHSTRAADARLVHRLVNLLEDRDRAVRMYAILALERLCGTTYGYKYYAGAAERAAAVGRWRAALRAGAVAVGAADRPRPAAGPASNAAGLPGRNARQTESGS